MRQKKQPNMGQGCSLRLCQTINAEYYMGFGWNLCQRRLRSKEVDALQCTYRLYEKRWRVNLVGQATMLTKRRTSIGKNGN